MRNTRESSGYVNAYVPRIDKYGRSSVYYYAGTAPIRSVLEKVSALTRERDRVMMMCTTVQPSQRPRTCERT